MSGPKESRSFPVQTPKGLGWGRSADPKGLGWGRSADPRGLGAGSMSGPKSVWVWVLCCHEPIR